LLLHFFIASINSKVTLELGAVSIKFVESMVL
jgi:hypothetical protein